MITSKKESSKEKKVLLFSGGMDSLIFSKLINPDILLYMPTGAIYEQIETKKIEEMIRLNVIDNEKVIIENDIINLSRFERDDAIVPNRNIFLITIASIYGEEIILSSVSGDRSCDKDEVFYFNMIQLLNHVWQEQHWTEKRTFKIYSPYKQYTKTEIVELYLNNSHDPNHLLLSYSCYTGEEPVCGQCKPCFRKWVSLINNNIKIPNNYYKNSPWESSWLRDIKPLLTNQEYRGKEDFDWIKALKSVNKYD